MRVYLVIGWERYEEDVILSVCKTEAIAKEIILDRKAMDEDDNHPLFKGYYIKEMELVE